MIDDMSTIPARLSVVTLGTRDIRVVREDAAYDWDMSEASREIPLEEKRLAAGAHHRSREPGRRRFGPGGTRAGGAVVRGSP
ncbi:hypothetical protein ACFHYQ_02615 [Sphaerimonospora cavernae]|uniref:Uncharacterized protein n=1 Tax=Sphaerimonospora cavernae TaxID=1740611 RepID=A0ABV6TY95_9ACTN